MSDEVHNQIGGDDIPYELMQRAGLLQDPETAPYVSHDVDLDTDEIVTLLSSVGTLTERQAEAFVLRQLEDIPREQAAEQIGISTSTLDDYVADAKAKVSAAYMTMKTLRVAGAEDWTAGLCE